MWLSTIARADQGEADDREDAAWTTTGFPQPTGEFEDLPADSLVLALGQEAELSLLDGVPGIVIDRWRRSGRLGPDDRPARHLRRRRHGARRTHRHGWHRPWQARGPHIDAWLRRTGTPTRPARRARPEPPTDSTGSIPGTTPMRRPASGRELDAARRIATFDEVIGGLDEATALFEARRCLSCGNCFECDNCYGVCPDNAVIKLGPGLALRDRPGLLQGLRDLRGGMPVRCYRYGAGAHLSPRTSSAGTLVLDISASQPIR